jgi:hypothetical protein
MITGLKATTPSKNRVSKCACRCESETLRKQETGEQPGVFSRESYESVWEKS